MTRHLASRVFLFAAIASCLFAGCKREAQPSAPTTTAAPAKPAASKAADKTHPKLDVVTLDGKPYSLAAQRGQWVVVNFWATWCGPCLKEMPELSALDAMREHVEVIGLDYEDIEPDALKTFLERHPVVYPVAIVDVYDPPKDFDPPVGLPNTYLVDPNGKVAKRFLGPITAKDIDVAIAADGGPALPEPPG